jgi:DNA-directed RNA polymerase specialized sigma24 family protein
MALLPSRNYSDQAVANILLSVKKGNKAALGEFIWQNQERFYVVAYLATGNHEDATLVTMGAFREALTTIKNINPQALHEPVWDLLAGCVVLSCADFHRQHATTKPQLPATDPTNDGSNEGGWEGDLALNGQKPKRCLGLLPDNQRKTFILRHQLGLTLDQIGQVLNEDVGNVMAWLFRARVQMLKCLGR